MCMCVKNLCSNFSKIVAMKKKKKIDLNFSSIVSFLDKGLMRIMEMGEGLQVQVVQDTAQAPSLWAVKFLFKGKPESQK